MLGTAGLLLLLVPTRTSAEFPVRPVALGDDPMRWGVSYASDGRTYYYDKQTRQAQWDLPEAFKDKSKKKREDAQWDLHSDVEEQAEEDAPAPNPYLNGVKLSKQVAEERIRQGQVEGFNEPDTPLNEEEQSFLGPSPNGPSLLQRGAPRRSRPINIGYTIIPKAGQTVKPPPTQAQLEKLMKPKAPIVGVVYNGHLVKDAAGLEAIAAEAR